MSSPLALARRTLALPLTRTIAAATGVCTLLVFTAWKGLVRHPHPWAFAQLSLNYSDGVVKRGLVGTLVHPIYADVSRQLGLMRLERFSEWMLAACFALTLAVCWRLLKQGRDAALAACVFASAPMIWLLGMCLGYLDAVVLALGLVGVLLARRSVGWLVAACVVGLFVHELAALLLVPLLPLTAFDPAARFGVDRRRFIVALIGGAGCGAIALWLFHRAPTAALEHSMRTAPIAFQHWIGVLLELMRMNLKQDWARVGSNKDLYLEYLSDTLRFLPATLMITGLGLARIGSAMRGWARAMGMTLFAGAALASIVMVRIAFDYSRLFSITNAEAFLAFALLADRVPRPKPGIASRVLLGIAAAVVVCQLLQPAQFTFMLPQARYWPASADRWMKDPLGGLADRAVRLCR